MNHLPKNLKILKTRIHARRLFARIIRTAFITLAVSCVLIVAFLFIGVASVLPSRWGDGGSPLPPATPNLRYARTDCLRDITSVLLRRRFEVRRQDDSIYFYTYSDI